MANNSMSSSSSPSFYEPPVEFTEEKITLLYHELKMKLQGIQNVAEEFNDNMKIINKNANISSQLIAAIQDKISGKNADTPED